MTIARRIHPSAVVEDGAELGSGVSVGAFSYVCSSASVGAGSEIGSHCVIGYSDGEGSALPLFIGENARVRSHSVIYAGSRIGARLETGHHVSLREHIVAGENLRVGTSSDVEGDCEIGDFVRVHGNVQIGKRSRIGSFVWIFSNTILTNDPTPPSEASLGVTVLDYAVLAAGAIIAPGVTVGQDSVVGAGSFVKFDVPDKMLAAGNPARLIGPARLIKRRDDPRLAAYPWRNHFRRGYPREVTDLWG